MYGGDTPPSGGTTETIFHSSENEKFWPKMPEIILMTLAKNLFRFLKMEVRN